MTNCNRNIIILTEFYPSIKAPSHGIFIEYLARELSKYYNIRIYHPRPFFLFKTKPVLKSEIEKKNKYEKEKYGISIIRPQIPYIPIGDRIWIRTIFFAIISFFYVLKNRKSIDLVFGQMACPAGFAAVIIQKFFMIPAIITARGSDVNNYPILPVLKHFTDYAFNNATQVITVANDLSNKLMSLYSQIRHPICIRNGVNHKIFNYRTKKSKFKNKIILFVGHLIPRKAILELIEAYSKMQYLNKTKLLIVGNGELQNEVIHKINSLNLNDDAILLGVKSHIEIAKLMNESTILCLPSYSEGTPNVVLEALSCGLPVVATNVSGIPEIILEINIGTLVKPGDIHSLSKALDCAINKEWNREYIAEYAKQFNWNITGTNYKLIIDRIINYEN